MRVQKKCVLLSPDLGDQAGLQKKENKQKNVTVKRINSKEAMIFK